VTQQNGAQPANYADDTLKLAEKEIRGHFANFGRKQGRDSTVSENISRILNETLEKMEVTGFSPSYYQSMKFYAYAQELFPALDIKGWPYDRKKSFLQWAYEVIPKPQPV
jgi:hypothetical protein